jgi:hypothetical protein
MKISSLGHIFAMSIEKYVLATGPRHMAAKAEAAFILTVVHKIGARPRCRFVHVLFVGSYSKFYYHHWWLLQLQYAWE